MLYTTITALTDALIPVLALLQQGGGYGFWGVIIRPLQAILVVSGGIGFLVGLAVKAGAGPRESAQATGNLIIEGALAGLLIGLSAGPLYGLLVGWTGD